MITFPCVLMTMSPSTSPISYDKKLERFYKHEKKWSNVLDFSILEKGLQATDTRWGKRSQHFQSDWPRGDPWTLHKADSPNPWKGRQIFWELCFPRERRCSERLMFILFHWFRLNNIKLHKAKNNYWHKIFQSCVLTTKVYTKSRLLFKKIRKRYWINNNGLKY